MRNADPCGNQHHYGWILWCSGGEEPGNAHQASAALFASDGAMVCRDCVLSVVQDAIREPGQIDVTGLVEIGAELWPVQLIPNESAPAVTGAGGER